VKEKKAEETTVFEYENLSSFSEDGVEEEKKVEIPEQM